MPDRRIDPQRLPPDPLEQGLDRLVSAGRQLVDGVSGARPGSRGGSRPSGPGAGPVPGRPRLGELGRWVEDKLEWILEDEDDWREPWQEPRPRRLPPSRRQPLDPGPGTPARGEGRRRPLEAISRRGEGNPRLQAPVPAAPEPPPAIGAAEEEWPGEETFSRARWQRPESPAPRNPPGARRSDGRGATQPAARRLPRSSRRRQNDG